MLVKKICLLIGATLCCIQTSTAMYQATAINLKPLFEHHARLLCFENMGPGYGRGEAYVVWPFIEAVALELNVADLSEQAAFLAITDIAHWAVTKKSEIVRYKRDGKKPSEPFLGRGIQYCLQNPDKKSVFIAPEVADFMPFMSNARRLNPDRLLLPYKFSTLVAIRQVSYMLYHYNRQHEYNSGNGNYLECRYGVQPAFNERNKQVTERITQLLEYIDSLEAIDVHELMDCARLWNLPVLTQGLITFIEKNRSDEAQTIIYGLPLEYLLSRFACNSKNLPFLFTFIIARLRDTEKAQQNESIDLVAREIASGLPMIFRRVDFLGPFNPNLRERNTRRVRILKKNLLSSFFLP